MSGVPREVVGELTCVSHIACESLMSIGADAYGSHKDTGVGRSRIHTFVGNIWGRCASVLEVDVRTKERRCLRIFAVDGEEKRVLFVLLRLRLRRLWWPEVRNE